MTPQLHTTDAGRGVAPVVGVVLLIAITVTLVATVGAFVVGVGGDLTQPTPSATIEVADADANLENDPTQTRDDGQPILEIEHRGGEALAYDELRIVIDRTDGDPKAVERDFTRAGLYLASSDTHTDEVQWEAGPFAANDALVVGESMTLTEANGTDVNIPEGSYEVTLIHEPSDTIIDEVVVTIE